MNESNNLENSNTETNDLTNTENSNTEIIDSTNKENSNTENNNEEVKEISSIEASEMNNEDNKFEIIYPDEYYENPDNCPAVFENECYLKCPNNTCLTPNDTNLVYCIPTKENYFVFNDICFENFYEIINNLKNISDKEEIISISPNISIIVYTRQTANNYMNKYQNLSIIYLNECEGILLNYYNLSNDTVLYILGIDSTNKNKSFVINVYNYGVFLENGFQLDHINVCKDTKITISSPIINTDAINIEDGYYFSLSGYDIYNENDTFYTEYCSSASINGNDITLKDRKNDFYPSDYILCNASCEYNYINYTSERFICECDLTYNFSEYFYSNNTDDTEEEEKISYLEYFISLFNYKIIPCYKLLLIAKNYPKNIGFYLSSITIFICLIEMFIFYIFGTEKIKKEILNGIPNRYKLKEMLNKKRKNRRKLEIAQLKKDKKKLKGNNINLNFIYINQSKPNNPPNKKILKTSKSCKLLNKSVNFKFNKKGKRFKTKTNLNNKNIKILTTNITAKDKMKILKTENLKLSNNRNKNKIKK